MSPQTIQVWVFIIVVFVATIFLKSFYKYFQIEFPSEYFSPKDYNNLMFSLSFHRYTLFYLVPPVFTIVFILALFQNTEFLSATFPLDYPWAGFLIALMYVLSTNGKALWRRMVGSSDVYNFFNKPSQVLFHFVHILALPFVGYLSGMLSGSSYVRALIPSSEGLRDNFWSAVLGAMFVVLLRKLLGNRTIETSKVYDEEKKKLPISLLKEIDAVATRFNASKELIWSICIAESLQRPRWFRVVERVKSLILPRGSYGIMQVQSDKFVNDKDSILIATEKFFLGTKEKDWEELEPFVRTYNPDNKYLEVVRDIFTYLTPPTSNYA